MADQKISALTAGAPAEATDELPIARAGANFKLDLTDVVDLVEATALTLTESLTITANDALVIGTNGGSISQQTAQTPDSTVFTTGTLSEAIIVCQEADKAVDFAHAAQTNPTLFVHSADAVTVADWISLAHNQTDAVISTGAGNLNLTPNGAVVAVTGAATVSTTLGVTGITTVTGGLTLPAAANFTIGTNGGTISQQTAQTPDSTVFTTGTLSEAVIICQEADKGVDFAHAAQTNPTLFIQSADSGTVADWISLAHNQTDAVISTGAGNLNLTPTGAVVAVTGAATVSTTLGVTGVTTLTGGSLTPADAVVTIGTNGGIISQQTAGTPDQSGLWTGTTGNAWLIARAADKAFDFAHAAQTNPTLFVHDASQSTTKWLGLTHDGTNGLLSVGTGDIRTAAAITATSGQIYAANANGISQDAASPHWFGGSGTSPSIRYATTLTPDALLITSRNGTSNSVHIAEDADVAFDFANGPAGTAVAVQPQLIVHSQNQSTTEYSSYAANAVQSQRRRALTEAGAAEQVFQITTATTESGGGEIHYKVHATDATPDYAVREGFVRFVFVNNAGTVTATLSAAAETGDGSVLINTNAKTLTYALTANVATANVFKFLINIDSDMTVSAAHIDYYVIYNGPGEVVLS